MTHLIICFSPQTVVMRRTLPHQPQSGWRSAGCSSFNPLPSGTGQGQDRVEALLRGVVDLAFVRADRGPLYTSIFPREPRGRRRRSQLSGWITLNQCSLWLIFLFMGQTWPLFVYFRPFLIPNTISTIQIEKKHRWCARDSNPGP